MKIGFVIPRYSEEKRVAILPEDMDFFSEEIEVYIERNFGYHQGVSDDRYEAKGAKVVEKSLVYEESDLIFNLKLPQKDDYKLFRKNQILMGWIHPRGSGASFMEEVAKPLGLTIIDIESSNPTIHVKGIEKKIDFILPHYLFMNSYIAGQASVLHALESFGMLNLSHKKIAVLGAGFTSQGAFNILSKLGGEPLIFYRDRIEYFLNNIGSFDIIVNGIEMRGRSKHLIDKKDLFRCKEGALLIDASADINGTIEGSQFTSRKNPIVPLTKVNYYAVSNTPSIFHKESSVYISRALSSTYFSENNWDKVRRLIDETRNFK